MGISWIDDRLAVGDITDVTLRDGLRLSGVEFVIDSRIHFSEYKPEGMVLADMYPLPSIWKFANDLLELSEKSKILIHCHGGIDRSPFVAMLYYKLKHGCDFNEAYDHICTARPQTIVHHDWVELVKEW